MKHQEPSSSVQGQDSMPRGFAEFWAAWPSSGRKQDRKTCAKVWVQKKLVGNLPAILAHIEACKQGRQWQEGFVPAPLTYLRGERWTDGPPPPAMPSSRDRQFAPVLSTDHVFGQGDDE